MTSYSSNLRDESYLKINDWICLIISGEKNIFNTHKISFKTRILVQGRTQFKEFLEC